MRMSKSIAGIAVITLAALIYVHQQVELLKLSYSIETKEKELKLMLDHKDRLDYNINNLEAPSRLEDVLMAKNIDVGFPSKHHVVKVAGAAPRSVDKDLRTTGIERKIGISGLLDFFGGRAEAQAKEK